MVGHFSYIFFRFYFSLSEFLIKGTHQKCFSNFCHKESQISYILGLISVSEYALFVHCGIIFKETCPAFSNLKSLAYHITNEDAPAFKI